MNFFVLFHENVNLFMIYIFKIIKMMVNYLKKTDKKEMSINIYVILILFVGPKVHNQFYHLTITN